MTATVGQPNGWPIVTPNPGGRGVSRQWFQDMPSCFVTSTKATAQGWAAAVDQAMGYPRVGVNFGQGPWGADPNTGGIIVTQTYADIIAHPNGTQWAYPATAVTNPVLSGAFTMPAPQVLTQDWSPLVIGAAAVSPPPPAQPMNRSNILGAAVIGLAAAGIAAGVAMGVASSPAPAPVVDAGADAGMLEGGE